MTGVGASIKERCIGRFVHSYIMIEPVQVVNCMRELKLGLRIHLDDVHALLPHSKLYRGRPQMLVVTMSCGRNLQLFPSGCIQIMGNLSHSRALSMSYEIVHHLRHLYPQVRMRPLTLKNLVVSVRLRKAIPLHRLKHSSSTLCYEPELFPALLMRRHHPIHIAVFHTGRCIITGLRSVEQGQCIVNELMDYLCQNNMLSP